MNEEVFDTEFECSYNWRTKDPHLTIAGARAVLAERFSLPPELNVAISLRKSAAGGDEWTEVNCYWAAEL